MGNYIGQLFSSVCNFSVLTVNRASPLSLKSSGAGAGGAEGWEEKHHFREMRQLSAICQPTIAAQLLGNGGKFEPYTIIIRAFRTSESESADFSEV
jgi:hypothetical protein